MYLCPLIRHKIMAITIKKASTMKELKRFIRFNYRPLKEDNPYSVPDLYDDMLNTFNKKGMRRLNSAKQSIF